MGWGLLAFLIWPLLAILYGVVIVLPVGSLLGWLTGSAFRHFRPSGRTIIALEFLAGITGICLGLYVSITWGGVVERWEDGRLVYQKDTRLIEYWIPLQIFGAVAVSSLLHVTRILGRAVINHCIHHRTV